MTRPAMAANTVLIVEDEPKLARLMADYLQAAAFDTKILSDGESALVFVRQAPPALVLLDLLLPGMDGVAVCEQLRRFYTGPIIMVTARVEEVDRLLGLEAGADDYLCKPISPREIVARVRAQLRRLAWDAAPTRPHGVLELDHAALRIITRGGRSLDLTQGEYRLLSLLMERPGRVYSRQQMLDRLHADGRAVTDRVVDSHIRNLRKKLEGLASGLDPIRSVYGVGYAFEWPPEGRL